MVGGARVGVIGGSGFYQMPDLVDMEEVGIETPFGLPSDNMVVGTLEGGYNPPVLADCVELHLDMLLRRGRSRLPGGT